MNDIAKKYWYREPWAWFNLVLLTLAIVCASVMSIVAIQHTPAEIGSRWYKEGVLAKRERQQEVLINQLHLQGELGISQSGQITFDMQYDAKLATQERMKEVNVNELQLYIEHPTNPEFDQTITLKRTAVNQYTGQLQGQLSGKRRLLISPVSDLWYLTSQAYFPAAKKLTFTPEMVNGNYVGE